MRKIVLKLLALCALPWLFACTQDSRMEGNVFLPEGDAAQGKAHFVSLGCTSCHVVVGADLPEPEADAPVRVILGSRTGRIMTYGDLVTSIINPSHKLARRYRKDEVSEEGQSIMKVYNDVMTVTQLSDLVAFLEKHYEKADRPGYRYPVYKYGDDK